MCTNPLFFETKKYGIVPVPCRSCLECCELYSNVWAMRCCDEAKLYIQNCVMTLTYSKTDEDLHREDFQKFIKRLRARIYPKKIRYFGCGEYGGMHNRPHAHLIIFGWCPDDLIFSYKRNGVDYYKSKLVESIWCSKEAWSDVRQGGFVDIAFYNYKAGRYCAKYLQKLDKRPHKVKPFTMMSLKPGIGAHSVQPSILDTGCCYVNGKKYPVPKYYLDILEKEGYNGLVERLRDVRMNIYKRKKDSFLNDDGTIDYSAVDSARKRGAIAESRLYRMKGV